MTAIKSIGKLTQQTRIIGLPLSILFCVKKSALGNAVDGVLVVHELTSIAQITYSYLLLMRHVQNHVFLWINKPNITHDRQDQSQFPIIGYYY
jgi:hypothetical protein